MLLAGAPSPASGEQLTSSCSCPPTAPVQRPDDPIKLEQALGQVGAGLGVVWALGLCAVCSRLKG